MTRRFSLSNRQVDLLLGVCVTGCVATGLTSWGVGTGWSRWWTAAHAIFGVMILVLTPAKMNGSVRTGLRRNRITRSISVGFGVLIVATIVLGFAHSTGAWVGVGYWTSLWTHFLLAFIATPLLLWHVLSRPARPRKVDLDRRLLVGASAAAALSATAVGAIELTATVFDTRARDRRFTGSHEIGSFDPDNMPTVAWIDDRAPTIDGPWPLSIDSEPVTVAELAESAASTNATLDCTGGWYSEQRWDAVPISDLVASEARSFRVTSSTGYSRIFPKRDADRVFLATGYDGRPLRRGHGAPVRLVAPGRRGPWWVKWVTTVETTDRPWWLQLPFPPT